MTRLPLHPRGMSIVMILIVLMLVSAAVAVLGLSFSADLRRTRAATTGAQLRQLLFAALPIAKQELTDHGPAARTLTPPTPVPSATLTLTFAPVSNEDCTVTATASLNALTTAQSLRFVKDPPTAPWSLKETRLTKSP